MGSYWDQERKHWRYQFKRDGIRYTGRGYKTKRDSEEAEAEHRKELKVAPHQTQTPMAFSHYAAQYLQYAERKFVKDVAKRKYSTFKKFIASQGDHPVDYYTPIHIHNYLNALPTNNAYNEHLQELSSLFAWIKKMEPYKFQFLVNPCLALGPMAVDEPDPPTPTVDEVLRIIAAAAPGDELDTVLCCLHLLARIDEVLRLRWPQDINFEKRTVTLWTRKRKDGKYESDEMPMNKVLYDVLMARWKRRTQDKWVFFNQKAHKGKGDRYYHRPRMMAAICKRAGIAPIGKGKIKLWRGKDKGKVMEIDHYYGFHSLRHFMASYLTDVLKISSKKVQRLLRHRNLSTTEGYVHFIDPDQMATMAIVEKKFAKLHPKGTPTNKKGVASQGATP
jgi:integrase